MHPSSTIRHLAPGTHFARCLALCLALVVSASQATVVTHTATLHDGVIDYFLGYYFTHAYTISTTVRHHDLHIGFRDGSQVDVGSYGGGGTASFSGNKLAMNSATDMSNAMTVHVDTVRDPSTPDGRQSVALSLDGTIISSEPRLVASATTPLGLSGTAAGGRLRIVFAPPGQPKAQRLWG